MELSSERDTLTALQHWNLSVVIYNVQRTSYGYVVVNVFYMYIRISSYGLSSWQLICKSFN